MFQLRAAAAHSRSGMRMARLESEEHSVDYEIAVKRYASAQLPHLFELFRTYFPEGDRLLSVEYSDWLYGRNPFGHARMVWVTQASRWVAFMALVPIAMERAGARLSAYYVVNVLVDPQHQGKHLFARMITAAKAAIAGESCALIGHPNAQAIKTWQRARVHFQEELRPALALPRIRSHGWNARRVRSEGDLDVPGSVFEQHASVRPYWKVAASPDYIRWRYLQHPASKYKVDILEHAGAPAGVQVSREMRKGIHLLIDQFVREQDLNAATRMLPLPTLCFIPHSAWEDMGGALVRVPWKKTVPYFCTSDPKMTSGEMRHFNLSASDF
jgi:GNAT superfamily N-acetyltransferase